MDRAKKTKTGFSEKQKADIINRLKKLDIPKACPMCGKSKWALANGYVKSLVQPHLANNRFGNVRLDDQFLPMIALVCTYCGFTSQHAAGILGMLQRHDEDAEQPRSTP